MYSFCRIASTWPRTMRATVAQLNDADHDHHHADALVKLERPEVQRRHGDHRGEADGEEQEGDGEHDVDHPCEDGVDGTVRSSPLAIPTSAPMVTVSSVASTPTSNETCAP